MFELQILFANVFVPTLLCALALWVVAAVDRKRTRSTTPEAPERRPEGAELLVDEGRTAFDTPPDWARAGWIAAAALAIAVAFGFRNGWQLWPEDAWRRIPVGALVAAVGSLLGLGLRSRILQSAVQLLTLLLACRLIFPRGEAWDFLLPARGYWFTVIVGSTWIGWWVSQRKTASGAGILSLSWIGCLVAGALLSSESFLKATEPLLAVACVFGCGGIAAIWLRRASYVYDVTSLGLFTFAAGVASAQFNSFLGLPNKLSYLAIAAPAIVALSGCPLAAGVESRRARWLPLVVSLALAAAVIAWTMQLSGGSGAEEW